jgi:hypothetical protein
MFGISYEERSAMKQFVFFIAVLMLTGGLCRAEGFEITGKTESYTAKVVFLDGQPVNGANRVRIDILDARSRPVKDARVEIEYLMPSLQGKPPMMDYRATANKVGTAYGATLKLDMTGEWKVLLSITRAGRTEKATLGFVLK